MELLREFVDLGGIELCRDEVKLRRPRTCAIGIVESHDCVVKSHDCAISYCHSVYFTDGEGLHHAKDGSILQDLMKTNRDDGLLVDKHIFRKRCFV